MKNDDVVLPVGVESSARIYYMDAADRALSALKDGIMPEDFETAADLEQAVELMIEGGFARLSNTYGGHRIVELETAADLLREATIRVPGFNPVNAGLNSLYSRSVLLAAVLRSEPPHWKSVRGGRGVDHMGNMAIHCLIAAEDTIATLYVQGRDDLMLSPAPDVAAV